MRILLLPHPSAAVIGFLLQRACMHSTFRDATIRGASAKSTYFARVVTFGDEGFGSEACC